jgi:hypothetical protein
MWGGSAIDAVKFFIVGFRNVQRRLLSAVRIFRLGNAVDLR